MPRPTSEQLQEARRMKAEERRQEEEEIKRKAAEEAERLDQQRKARIAATASLRKRLTFLKDNDQKISQLESVLEGVYVEMDKLCKKAPADEVTELALKRVNDVIKRGKELMEGDDFIDSIDPFVAAGERPEHRDVLLILGDLKQGVKRLKDEQATLSTRAYHEKWAMLEDIGDDIEESDEGFSIASLEKLLQ